MSRSLRHSVMLIFATFIAATASAQGVPPALSAEIETTYTSRHGTHRTLGRYYQSKDRKMREDSPRGSVIVDALRGTVTLINPATKEATVIVTAGRSRAPKDEGNGGFEVFEETTANGHRLTKTRANRANGQTDEIWTNRDLGIVEYSRIVGPDVTVTRILRNIELGEPADAVFSIPKDYTVTHEALRSRPDLPAPGR